MSVKLPTEGKPWPYGHDGVFTQQLLTLGETMIYLVGNIVVRANSKRQALKIAASDLPTREVKCINENGPSQVISPIAASMAKTIRSGWLGGTSTNSPEVPKAKAAPIVTKAAAVQAKTVLQSEHYDYQGNLMRGSKK